MGVSIIAYAILRGFSGAAVRKAMKSGRITLEVVGTLDVDKVGEQWHGSANSAQEVVLSTSLMSSEIVGAVDKTIT